MALEMNTEVREAFEAFPAPLRKRLLTVRRLIIRTAAATEGVGRLTETLKWGQPAYLTEATKSGTTIRLGWKPSEPTRYVMYFHCRTNLVARFRTLFAERLRYEGDRAITFDVAAPVPAELISSCAAMALAYHRDKGRA